MVTVTLEKIDLVRDRTGVTYTEANRALEENDGDVVRAIMKIETDKHRDDVGGEDLSKGEEMLKKIKELVREGNVTRIVVKKDDDIIMNIPVNAGAIGIAISPFLGAVGLTAALVSKCEIEVSKSNGEVISINEYAEEGANKIKDTIKFR